MGMDRRDFIKLAGLSTLLGLGSNSALELLRPGQAAAALEGEAKPLTAKRWAMVVNMRQLDGETAQKCIAACDRVHNVPDFGNPIAPAMKLSAADKARWEIKWIWTAPYENTFPGDTQEYVDEKVKDLKFLLLCNHCDNPPCVRVCPTKATFRQEDGIVMMDMHRCIGCRFCMAACPFGARSFNWKDPRPYIKEVNPDYPTREIGVVEKCLFCSERLAIGLMPACVVASQGALAFGDLRDPKSKVRELLDANFTIRRKPFLGTNPQVYYIV